MAKRRVASYNLSTPQGLLHENSIPARYQLWYDFDLRLKTVCFRKHAFLCVLLLVPKSYNVWANL